jgi:hypothetical protein
MSNWPSTTFARGTGSFISAFVYFAGESTSTTLNIVLLQRKCGGAIVSQVSHLAPLRFCTIIEGNLSLLMSESTAVDSDFNVFGSLEEIRGQDCLSKKNSFSTLM